MGTSTVNDEVGRLRKREELLSGFPLYMDTASSVCLC